MNQVVLIGRLTKDPETRTTQGGIDVASYTLAVDRFGDGTDFIRCTAFGKAASFANMWLHKGVKTAITGRIQTGSYDDRDGKKVYTTDVIVNTQEFCESKQQSKVAGSVEAPDDDFVKIPEFANMEMPF